MASVVSTKNSEYNEFFAQLIESLDQYYDKTPRLVVVALPDGEAKEPHFSIFGADSYDLMDASALCQHEACKYLVYGACDNYMKNYFDDFDEFEELDYDESDEPSGQTV